MQAEVRDTSGYLTEGTPLFQLLQKFPRELMALWEKKKGVQDALARTSGCVCGRNFPRTSVAGLAQVSLPPPQPLKLSHKTLHHCFSAAGTA